MPGGSITPGTPEGDRATVLLDAADVAWSGFEAAALANPESIEIIDRSARKERKPARPPFPKRIRSYTVLVMIPVVIFMLLLLVARLK